MTDSYLVVNLLDRLLEELVRQYRDQASRVVSVWRELCPDDCGEGEAIYLVRGNGDVTVRCLGCKRPFALGEDLNWEYTDL